jgi:hypothetical protein
MNCKILALVALFTAAIPPLPVSVRAQSGVPSPPPMGGHYLYRTELIQAAPGKLTELIDLYKKKMQFDRDAGDEPALWMRHSQGDRWDLLRLVPMGNYSEYYKAQREAARAAAATQSPWLATMSADIAWEEDVFVTGPPLADLRKAFADGAFFHVEMFQALPGHVSELEHERDMENAYSAAIGQPQNFVFMKDQGAAWDLFTVGVFRNLKHYSESSDVPPEKAEAAARGAGFSSASDIGPYLRRWIALHHDTLAVAVK